MKRQTMRMISMLLVLVLTWTSIDFSSFAAEIGDVPSDELVYETATTEESTVVESAEVESTIDETTEEETVVEESSVEELVTAIETESETETMEVVGEALPEVIETVTGDDVVSYNKSYKTSIDNQDMYPVALYAPVEYDLTTHVGPITCSGLTLGDRDIILAGGEVAVSYDGIYGVGEAKSDYSLLEITVYLSMTDVEGLDDYTDVPMTVTVDLADSYNEEEANHKSIVVSKNITFENSEDHTYENMPQIDVESTRWYMTPWIPLDSPIAKAEIVGGDISSELQLLSGTSNYGADDFDEAYPIVEIPTPDGYTASRAMMVGTMDAYRIDTTVPIMPKGVYDLKITTEQGTVVTHKNMINITTDIETVSDDAVLVQDSYYRDSSDNVYPFIYVGFDKAGSVVIDSLTIDDEDYSRFASSNKMSTVESSYDVIRLGVYGCRNDQGEMEIPEIADGSHNLKVLFHTVESGPGVDNIERICSYECTFYVGGKIPTSSGMEAYSPNAPANGKQRLYSNFVTSLATGETVKSAKLIKSDASTTTYVVGNLNTEHTYKTTLSCDPYKYNLDIPELGSCTIRDSNYRFEDATNVYISYTIPFEKMENGTYNIEITTSKGNTFTIYNAVFVERDRPLVRSSYSVNAGRYVCDSTGDYIAVVVYGDRLSTDLVPKFYSSYDPVGGFGEEIAVYDPSDENCAMSPDLGDGIVYKIRKSEAMKSVPGGSYILAYDSEDVIYLKGESDPVNTEGKCIGKKGSFSYNAISKVVYSNTDAKKILRVYIANNEVEKRCLTTGDLVQLSTITWIYNGSMPTRKYTYYTGNLCTDATSQYYVEVPASDPYFKAVSANGSGQLLLGEDSYYFFIESNGSIKVLNNLTAASDWKIRNTTTMNVIYQGQKGTAVLTKDQLARLSAESSVLVELYSNTGALTSSYYACFKSIASDVITYVNDGEYEEDICNPAVLLKGDTAELKTPARDNYIFGGWYTDAKLTNKVTSITAVGGRTVTLYAKWTGVEYTITLHNGVTSREVKVPYDARVSGINYASALNIADGYEVTGWAGIDGGESMVSDISILTVESLASIFTSVEKKLDIYAVVEPVTYSINYVTNGYTGDTDGWPRVYTIVSDDVILPDLTGDATLLAAGFEFRGWYESNEFKDDEKVAKIAEENKGDVTVYAKLVTSEYTLKFDSNIASFEGLKLTSTAELEPETHNYGEIYNLPANVYTVANEDGVKFTFAGWSLTPDEAISISDKAIVNFAKSDITDGSITLYANYKSSFTISYNGLDGVADTSAFPTSYDYGKAASLPVPVKAGYNFLGWYNDAGVKVGSITRTTSGNLNLTARWEEKSYKLVLNPNGGKGKAVTLPVYYTESLIISDYLYGFSKTGYTATEFTYNGVTVPDDTFNPEAYGDVFGAKGSKIVLKAVYTPDKFTLKYNTNGGVAIADAEYAYSTTETPIDVPVRAGYTFAGWFRDANFKVSAGKYDASKNIFKLKKGTLGDEEGNINLYAKWTANYKVVLINTKNSEAKEFTGYSYLVKKALPATPFTAEGETVSGWKLSADGTEADYSLKQVVDGSANLTLDGEELKLVLYTIWDIPALVLNANGGEYAGGETAVRKEYELGKAKSFNELKTVLSVNPTRVGYTFGGWYLDKACKNQGKIKATDKSDIQLYAKWNPLSYTVTFVDGYNRYTQTISYGKSVALKKNTFTNTSGYAFCGWSQTPGRYGLGDVEFTNKQKVTDLGNVILYPVWASHFTIDFDINTDDLSAVAGDRTSYSYRYGATVKPDVFKTISQPSRPGYVFSGWCTDINCKKAFKSITPSTFGDFTLYAKWTPAKFKVTFDGNVPAGSSLKGKMKTQQFTYLKSAALLKNAYSVKGYTFSGWSTTPDGPVDYLDRDKIDSIYGECPVGGSAVLYAVWAPVTYSITYVGMDGYTNPNPSTYDASTGVSLEDPEAIGYTFEGWYSDKLMKNRISEITVGSTGNRTIYAKWKLNRN